MHALIISALSCSKMIDGLPVPTELFSQASCLSVWGSIPSFQNPPPLLLHIASCDPWVYVDFSTSVITDHSKKVGNL